MPENQLEEFKVWGIPVKLRKYLYAGILSGLITFNIIQYVENKKCKDQMYQEMKSILDKELQALSNRLNPQIEETQKRVDSLDNKINKQNGNN